MSSERDQNEARERELAPIWIAFPDVSPMKRRRPHAWNEYSEKWRAWFFSRTVEQQREYVQKYPEPDEWIDFYRFIGHRDL